MQSNMDKVCGKAPEHEKADISTLKQEKRKLDQTLTKMTEACEKLKQQLSAAN